MNPQKSQDELRIERLIAMASRLIEALESDIAELSRGNALGLRTIDPEIQKLSALYGREAAGLNREAAEKAPPELRKHLVEATRKFRDLLSAQARLLTRLRGASEGLVRAVAEEIERQRAPMQLYGAAQSQRPAGALLYNNVV